MPSQKDHLGLVWRNASESQFWAPYVGQISATDFSLFPLHPFTFFEKDLPAMYK